MVFLFDLIYSQLFISLPPPTKSFAGQTIIVTGSNVGLGLEAARHFVRLDAAKVILAVRTIEKGEEAKKSIEQSTGRQGVVEVWPLDLTSFESVKQFVAKAETLTRLDVVLENAGIAAKTFRLKEGNEETITVNVLSTFLLAMMILPKLRETASKYNTTPYLTVVSSDVQFMAKFTERNSPDIFEALNDNTTKKVDMSDRYCVSKIMEVFYCRELAARTKQGNRPSVIVNFLNPGLCYSALDREGSIAVTILRFFLARSTEVGSRTLVHAATAGDESYGQYLSNCRIEKPAPLVLGEQGAKLQQKVWDQVSQKLEAIQPGVMANV